MYTYIMTFPTAIGWMFESALTFLVFGSPGGAVVTVLTKNLNVSSFSLVGDIRSLSHFISSHLFTDDFLIMAVNDLICCGQGLILMDFT